MTYEEEFSRLRHAIYNEGLGKVYLYTDKEGFDGVERAWAYVNLWGNPPFNIILAKKGISWRKLVLTLGHEYGHIVDFVRYRGSRRWKAMKDKKIKDLPKQSMFYKKSLLKTEFMAESYIPKFIDNFNVQIKYSPEELNELLYLDVLIVKYEILYGKHPTATLKKQWKHRFRCRRPKITPNWAYNLKKLLD